jgi:hypothetical protein
MNEKFEKLFHATRILKQENDQLRAVCPTFTLPPASLPLLSSLLAWPVSLHASPSRYVLIVIRRTTKVLVKQPHWPTRHNLLN